MEKKPKQSYGEWIEGVPHNYVAEVLDNPDNVASANGTTGLIPTPPLNQGQAASYNDICAVPQQVSSIVPPVYPKEEEQQ